MKLIPRLWLGPWSKTAKDFAAEALAEVLHSILQVEIDRPNVDPETVGNLPVRLLMEMSRNEDIAPARRQFRQRPLELRHFDPRLRNRTGIRSVVGEIEDRLDISSAQELLIAFASVTGNVERHPEQIVERAANLDSIGDAIDAEERLMQRLTGKVGGAKTARQPLGQPLIFGRKGLPQRSNI